MKSIVIFGAGIAGLSAAHELVQSGYTVSVYEALDQPGGFFRSSRLGEDNMPSEYTRAEDPGSESVFSRSPH